MIGFSSLPGWHRNAKISVVDASSQAHPASVLYCPGGGPALTVCKRGLPQSPPAPQKENLKHPFAARPSAGALGGLKFTVGKEQSPLFQQCEKEWYTKR